MGQIAVSQWRDHLPYNYGERVAIAGEDVYLVTNVGLLKYTNNSGETEKLTKIVGLSDSGVESVEWHEGLEYVILGYLNIFDGPAIQNINGVFICRTRPAR